jgi:thiol-disulfide isomerase/thioredoxin
MRVVAVMLTPDDAAGKNFGCNNANECAVGSSVDFLLVGDSAGSQSRFERNVCVMEFTGQWCSYCPDGAQLLEFLASDIYPGQVLALAFHNDDDFTIPAEAELANKYNISDYPSYLTDMRESGSLSGSGCRLSIETSLYESQTHSSVAIASQVADGVCKVDAKLFSEKSMEYRMAAYAVEDRVVAWQTTSGNSRNEDYVHRHVVRKLLSESVSGDALGVVNADQEKEHSYEFNVESSWNLENMSVVVLAIDKNGNVNNAAQCALNGGSVEYEMKK